MLYTIVYYYSSSGLSKKLIFFEKDGSEFFSDAPDIIKDGLVSFQDASL